MPRLSPYSTKESVINELLNLYHQGVDMRNSYLAKNYGSLFNAAKRRFGTYANAIEAIGLDYSQITSRRFWTTDLVLSTIKQLHSDGMDISIDVAMKRDGGLVFAACKYFGNWENAITAAGLDYEQIRKTERWTKGRIIKDLRELNNNGEDLFGARVRKNHAALYTAACRLFGTYPHALKSAGLWSEELDYSRCRKWSKAKVQSKLQEILEKDGTLNARHIQKKYGNGFYGTCALHFGSYANAVESIGIPYSDVQRYTYWSKERVIEELKSAASSDILSLESLNQGELIPLRGAIERWFGTLRDACLAAGVDYESNISLEGRHAIEMGHKFENLLKRILEVVAPEYKYHKRYGDCIPDFSHRGHWIDAKLGSSTAFYYGKSSLTKYPSRCRKLTIVYLLGNPVKCDIDNVEFLHVSTYTMRLWQCGRFDLAQEIDDLITEVYGKDTAA